MQNSGKSLIQAVEWKPNMPATTGTFKSATLIHCVVGGDITAKFPGGDKTRTCVPGDDFALAYVDVVIVSGTFDIN